jgi:hypothetical protein
MKLVSSNTADWEVKHGEEVNGVVINKKRGRGGSCGVVVLIWRIGATLCVTIRDGGDEGV